MHNLDENGFIIENEEIENEIEQSYFIVLTNDVLADKELSDFQKILFATISSLTKARGYCWANNAYLEKLLNKKETQVSMGISKLVERGYINREIILKKKIDENGKIITTKQVAFRKLTINTTPQNQKGGILENQKGGILENQKHNNINIINNNTNNLLHKLSDEPTASSLILEKEKIKNNYLEEENKNEECGNNLVREEKVFETLATIEKPKKGLGPLIDEINIQFPKDQNEEINLMLVHYLKTRIGIRRLPSLEDWKKELNNLKEYSGIKIAGADGKKFITQRAKEIITKATYGINGVPFLEFDDIYNQKNVMEPQFNLNQDFNRGY